MPKRKFRSCRFEQLEARTLLAVTSVQSINPTGLSGYTGEKPESKVWEYNNAWWSVWSNSNGTYVHRLDGSSWTPVLKLNSTTSMRADVKQVGNLAHILLHKDQTVQLASVQYVSGSTPSYKLWTSRPSLTTLSLSSGPEAATIDVDSTGRMWMAYDNGSKIETRHSSSPYSSWSSAIVLASNVNDDDISVVTALPDKSIGVFWSNQTTQRFGFRRHLDGTSTTSWTADEVPASQSALNVGAGMADDHMNLAVASNGTLYAAIKTGYDRSGHTQLGLLVRRPNGTWDNIYEVDQVGTRPIVDLSEVTNTLLYTYRIDEQEPIVYRECNATTMICTDRHTLIGDPQSNDASSTKQNFTDDLVIIGSGNSKVTGARISFNQNPVYTATFQDGLNGYSGTRDASFNAVQPSSNFGNAASLTTDGDPDYASLIKWDVSSIPTGMMIESAAITVNVTGKSTDSYEFYEVLRPWVETAATWNRYDTGLNWQIAGAQDSTDRGSTIVAAMTASNLGVMTIPLNAAGIAMVQKWVNNPSANNGVVLQDYSAFNGLIFDSSEAATVNNRPKLTISYTAAPPPSPTVQNVTFQDGVNGYAGTRDAFMSGSQRNTNFGSSTSLSTDGDPDYASLIKWDVSTIPAGSSVQSAAITLNVSDYSVDTYELYEVLRPWVESNVTWNSYSSGLSWQTAGAQGSSDRGSTAIGSITASDVGIVTISLNSAGIAMVQKWVNTPSANNGIIFQDYREFDGMIVDSSEASNVNNRPKLSVSYVSGSSSSALTAEGEAAASWESISTSTTNDSPIFVPVLPKSDKSRTPMPSARPNLTAAVIFPTAAILHTATLTRVPTVRGALAKDIDQLLSDEEWLTDDFWKSSAAY